MRRDGATFLGAALLVLALPDGAMPAPDGCVAGAERLWPRLDEAARAGDAGALDALGVAEAGLAGRILPVVSYRRVRVREEAGQCLVLMRRVLTDGGFAYHELVLEAAAGGEPGDRRVAQVRTSVLPPDVAAHQHAADRASSVLSSNRPDAVDAFLAAAGGAAEVLRSIDRVDASIGPIGGDPFLDHLRAQIHEHAGARDDAARSLEAAIARDAGFLDAYTALLHLRLRGREHDLAVEVLDRLEAQFDFLRGSADALGGEYPEFLASPELAAWRARRRAER